MKALVRDRYGGPDVLSVADVPAPTPADDEVLVRARVCSLNAADVDYLRGFPVVRMAAPFRPKDDILGSDVAGRVEAVESKVGLFEPGDEVYGDTFEDGFGGLAELVAVKEEKLAPIPLGMDAAIAATLPQAGLLAWQGLTGWGGVTPGQRVLINGGGGGMGTVAIQLAKALGAEVIGVDSAAKLELMRSLGADEVLDYAEVDFTETADGYDRVIDALLTRSVGRAQGALTPTGIYIVVGGPLRRIAEVATMGTLRSATSKAQLRLLMWRSMDRVDLAGLERAVLEGVVRPVIEESVTLDEAPRAFERLAAGQVLGKAVIGIADLPVPERLAAPAQLAEGGDDTLAEAQQDALEEALDGPYTGGSSG